MLQFIVCSKNSALTVSHLISGRDERPLSYPFIAFPHNYLDETHCIFPQTQVLPPSVKIFQEEKNDILHKVYLYCLKKLNLFQEFGKEIE